MRLATAAFLLTFAVSSAAHATGPAAEQPIRNAAEPRIAARPLLPDSFEIAQRRAVNRLLARKDTTVANTLRRRGDFVGAAEVLTEGPKAKGIFNRFRRWWATRRLYKAARKNLKANFDNSRPEEARQALEMLDSAGKLGWFKRWRINNALKAGGRNALRTAARLGDKNRFEDALALLEYSRSRNGDEEPGAIQLSESLYERAMRSAESATHKFELASRLRDEEGQQVVGNRALNDLNYASQFATIADSVPRERAIFDTPRAEAIAARLGTTLKEIDEGILKSGQAAEQGGIESVSQAEPSVLTQRTTAVPPRPNEPPAAAAN